MFFVHKGAGHDYRPLIVYSGAVESLQLPGNSGSMEQTDLGLLKIERQIFVGDTKDGGASDWIAPIDGMVEQTRYLYQVGTERLNVGWRADEKNLNATDKPSPFIRASCACQSVDFYLTRPDAASADPDLDLRTLHDPNREKKAWWLAGPKQDKYLANCCACTSCRCSSGTEFVSWAFIPRHNIRLCNGSDFSIDAFETLKTYKSSERSTWCFCGKCGAMCFLILETQRPAVVDMAAGLLWGNGARAEEWLEWKTDGISFEGEGRGRPLVEALRKGLQSKVGWGGSPAEL